MATWPESVWHPLVANPPADRSVVDTTIKEFPERMGPAKKVTIMLEQFPIGKYNSQWSIECPSQKLEEVAVIVVRRSCAFID